MIVCFSYLIWQHFNLLCVSPHHVFRVFSFWGYKRQRRWEKNFNWPSRSGWIVLASILESRLSILPTSIRHHYIINRAGAVCWNESGLKGPREKTNRKLWAKLLLQRLGWLPQYLLFCQNTTFTLLPALVGRSLVKRCSSPQGIACTRVSPFAPLRNLRAVACDRQKVCHPFSNVCCGLKDSGNVPSGTPAQSAP